MFGLALLAVTVLPFDTCYISQQPEINNLAENISVNGRSFRGPGPYTVHFEADVDSETTYYAWELANDQNFDDIFLTYHELDVDYEFAETGTYYARFTTSNADNSQETYSEIYTFQVTESLLEIPNLFTPDSPTGNNLEFKVKYKSLVNYEIWVYNRWGNLLFHSKDPSQGWDGHYKGKLVPTGAYYYLVKAVGADGIKYSRKGDINVLRLKTGGSTTSNE